MRTAALLMGIFMLCVTSAGSAKASDTMTLISKKGPAPVIVIGVNASPSEKYAAEEMAVYLEKITGRKIETVDDSKIPEGKVIAIGRSKLTESVDISRLHCEQYVIDVQSNMIIIIGGRRAKRLGQSAREAGTLYGVYEFLEGLGVRWYRPEPWGEHVPQISTIKLKIGRSVSRQPSYPLMRSSNGGGICHFREETEDDIASAAMWAARNRLNGVPNTGNYHRNVEIDAKIGGRENYGWGHIFGSVVPEAEYFKSHPEYFALVKGKRDPIDLCVSNPDVQRLFAEKIIARATEFPQWSSISGEPDDCRGALCECEPCRAMDQPKITFGDGIGSNRVAAFNNGLARVVAAKAPWIKLQWLAYSSHTAAPQNVKQMEPNTIIMPAPINQWDDWRKKLMDPSSAFNSKCVQMMKDWVALKPSTLMVYQYWEGYGWAGPLPMTRMVADRLRNYRDLGVTGLYWESVMSWGPQGLDYYMVSKLAWNPDIDIEKELNLYYKNYYGPAARPMKKYHEAWMKALENGRYFILSGGRGMHTICTPALIKEIGKYMDDAQSLVKGHPLYERRLKGVWAGYEFSRRVSEILVLKKTKGVSTGATPPDANANVPPDMVRPPFAGTGTFLHSTEAENAYRDLMRWMRSVNSEDVVFDMHLNPEEDVAETLFPKNRNADVYGSCFLAYMPYDMLRNELYPNDREEVVLKDF